MVGACASCVDSPHVSVFMCIWSASHLNVNEHVDSNACIGVHLAVSYVFSWAGCRTNQLRNKHCFKPTRKLARSSNRTTQGQTSRSSVKSCQSTHPNKGRVGYQTTSMCHQRPTRLCIWPKALCESDARKTPASGFALKKMNAIISRTVFGSRWLWMN